MENTNNNILEIKNLHTYFYTCNLTEYMTKRTF